MDGISVLLANWFWDCDGRFWDFFVFVFKHACIITII